MALAGCRVEHDVQINSWLSAHVKTPPASVVRLLPQSISLSRNGTTLLESRSLRYLGFDDRAIAVRNSDESFAGLITRRGDIINFRDQGCSGDVLTPAGLLAVDCWTGASKESFAVIRFGLDGTMVFKAMAPRLTECGGTRMGFLGYGTEAQPVAAFECVIDGVRSCRAIELGPKAHHGIIVSAIATSTTSDCGDQLKAAQAWHEVARWAEIR